MTATWIETREVPLPGLKPFPGNARRGDVEAIRKSIESLGQYRALVVRKTKGDLIILAGNHTADALRAAGRESARCEIIECDDATAKKINIADNRMADLGSYDDQALVELIQGLSGDFAGIGYGDAEIEDLLSSIEEVPEEVLSVGATEARFSEAPDEMERRRESNENYRDRLEAKGEKADQPLGAVTELILVLTVEQKAEFKLLVDRVRESEGDLAAGVIVLKALREYAPDSDLASLA